MAYVLRHAREEEILAIFDLYAARGYLLRGACTDGPYHGILREKAL